MLLLPLSRCLLLLFELLLLLLALLQEECSR